MPYIDPALMSDEEKLRKLSTIIRKLCAWETRMGQTIEAYRKAFDPPGTKYQYTAHYEAVMITHAKGGPRELAKRLYGVSAR